MHTFILQDWTTVKSSGTGPGVTQDPDLWLDLSPFQDVVFWLLSPESTGSPSLNLQTSPTTDDAFFELATIYTQTITPSATPVVVPVYMATAPIPLARYVRWQISGGGAWDATFRIVVSANSPGF
jgi:hypothetical protein